MTITDDNGGEAVNVSKNETGMGDITILFIGIFSVLILVSLVVLSYGNTQQTELNTEYRLYDFYMYEDRGIFSTDIKYSIQYIDEYGNVRLVKDNSNDRIMVVYSNKSTVVKTTKFPCSLCSNQWTVYAGAPRMRDDLNQ